VDIKSVIGFVLLRWKFNRAPIWNQRAPPSVLHRTVNQGSMPTRKPSR